MNHRLCLVEEYMADACIMVYRMFGFLLGTSAAAYGTYYYVLEEYRLANEMLTEDIYVRVCI